MQPLSDAYTAALAGPHTVVSRVDIIRAGAPVERLESVAQRVDTRQARDAAVQAGVRVLDGRVQVKRTGGARRNGSVTLLDPPTITAYGDRIKAWRGVRFDDGTVEYAALGVFEVTQVQTVYAGGRRVVQVDGVDLTRAVAGRRWSRPYTITAGTLFTEAIADIIEDRLSGTATRIVGSPLRLVTSVFHDGSNDDPWQAIEKLAAACNRVAWFDPHGTFMLTPPPSRTDPIVHTITDGANGTILTTSRRESSDPGPNGVIVVGTNPAAGADVWGEAYDDDPASPTWRFGPYGYRPTYVGSSLVHTHAQARELAAAELAKLTLSIVAMDCTAAPHPGLEAGDRVRVVRRPDDLDTVVVVDTLDIPLGLGEMRVGSEQPVQALARTIRTLGAGSNPVKRIARRFVGSNGGSDGPAGEVTGEETPLPASPVPDSSPIPPDPADVPPPPSPDDPPPDPGSYDPYSIPVVAIEAPMILPPDSEFYGSTAGAVWEKDNDGNTVVSVTERNIVLWAKGDDTPNNDATLHLMGVPTDGPGYPAEAHLSAQDAGLHINRADATNYTVNTQAAVYAKLFAKVALALHASDSDTFDALIDTRDFATGTIRLLSSDYIKIKSNGASVELSAGDDSGATIQSLGTNGDGTVYIGATLNQLSFFDSGPAAQQTITGSRGGNAALANLLTALAAYGLIVDSTS